MLKITDTIAIDEADLTETFIRASGPGGQNVNKVASAVQLRFDLGGCDALSDDIKARVRLKAGRRLTSDDHILIEAGTYRTQKANREEARRRLAELIRAGVPRPARRKKTRPPRRAVETRLQLKKQRGLLKSSRRQRPIRDDE